MKKEMIHALLILGIIALPLMADAAGTVIFEEDFEDAAYVVGNEIPCSPTVVTSSGAVWSGQNWTATNIAPLDPGTGYEGINAADVITSNSVFAGKAMEVIDNCTSDVIGGPTGVLYEEAHIEEITAMGQDIINGEIEFDYAYVRTPDPEDNANAHSVAFGQNTGDSNTESVLFLQGLHKNSVDKRSFRIRVANPTGAMKFTEHIGVFFNARIDGINKHHIKCTFSTVSRTANIKIWEDDGSGSVLVDDVNYLLIPESSLPSMVVNEFHIRPWRRAKTNFQIDNIKVTDLGTSTDANEVWKLY